MDENKPSTPVHDAQLPGHDDWWHETDGDSKAYWYREDPQPPHYGDEGPEYSITLAHQGDDQWMAAVLSGTPGQHEPINAPGTKISDAPLNEVLKEVANWLEEFADK